MATWDNFYIAANNAVRTGKHIGEVLGIDLLIKGLDVDIDKIHAIGHSLGGHLIGHFGRTIKKLGGNGPIHRITCKYLYIYSEIFSELVLCPVHSIFRFSFFGQNDQKRKNQMCCLFIFCIKKIAFCLKVTFDFFVFWSLWPKTKSEKWNELDIK